jgi:hypothetical protein
MHSGRLLVLVWRSHYHQVPAFAIAVPRVRPRPLLRLRVFCKSADVWTLLELISLLSRVNQGFGTYTC